jgi:hypothetical protein
MRGRQLRSLRLKKNNQDFFPDVHVRGRTEEINLISPKVKLEETQKYLKNVSNVPKIGFFATTATQSDSNTQVFTEAIKNLDSKKTSHRILHEKVLKKVVKEEKDFKIDINSKFSLYLHRLKGKKLDMMSKELFPEELCEAIQYLPDYFESTLKDPLTLNSTQTTRRSKKKLFKTVKNVTASNFFPTRLNLDSISRHKFSQYSTELRGRQSYFSSFPSSRGQDSVLIQTDRGCRSTGRRYLESIK